MRKKLKDADIVYHQGDTPDNHFLQCHSAERLKFKFTENNIAYMRRRCNLSQAELAAALGVPAQKFISDWEKANRAPSLAQAITLAAILDCSVYELMGIPGSDSLRAAFSLTKDRKAELYGHRMTPAQMDAEMREWDRPGNKLTGPDARFSFLGEWQTVLPIWAMEKADALYCRAYEEKKNGAELYPSLDLVFRAFQETPPDKVKIVLVGKSPYCDVDSSDGLAFSSQRYPLPYALMNLLCELRNDLGIEYQNSGSLLKWAQNGALLLNTYLTAMDEDSISCARWGWEDFAAAVISACSRRPAPKVFILLGMEAKALVKYIDKESPYNRVITAPHPSPFSAKSGFFGSRPFSKANEMLVEMGGEPMDWSLTEGG